MDKEKRRDYSLSFAAITIGLPILVTVALWRGIKGFVLGVWRYVKETKGILFDD